MIKWLTVQLRTIVEASSGVWGKPPLNDETDTPVLRSTNIHDGRLVLDEIAERSLTNHLVKRYRLQDGDIIVTSSSGSGHLIGKCAIFYQPTDKRPYLFSNFTQRLRPNPKVVTPRYLYYYLLSPRAKAELDRIHTTTSGLRNLNITLYLQQKIPLPSISEQNQIVGILEQADTLRNKRAEADAKAARILPARFYKIFGDPATNPKKWPVVYLDEVISDTRNGLYKPAEFYGSGISILKMFNIQNGELNLSRVDFIDVTDDEYEAYRLNPGDVLINRVNTPELVGKCAVITEEVGKAVFESKNIRMRVRTNLVTPEFIAAYLNSPFGHGSLRSGVKHAIGMATINNADLRSTRVFLPPIDAQKKWSGAVSRVRSLTKMSAISSHKIDSIFRNLLNRAFSGDLTTKWREVHMKELLSEIEAQTKYLNK